MKIKVWQEKCRLYCEVCLGRGIPRALPFDKKLTLTRLLVEDSNEGHFTGKSFQPLFSAMNCILSHLKDEISC